LGGVEKEKSFPEPNVVVLVLSAASTSTGEDDLFISLSKWGLTLDLLSKLLFISFSHHTGKQKIPVLVVITNKSDVTHVDEVYELVSGLVDEDDVMFLDDLGPENQPHVVALLLNKILAAYFRDL
jgi:hypothetical protein